MHRPMIKALYSEHLFCLYRFCDRLLFYRCRWHQFCDLVTPAAVEDLKMNCQNFDMSKQCLILWELPPLAFQTSRFSKYLESLCIGILFQLMNIRYETFQFHFNKIRLYLSKICSFHKFPSFLYHRNKYGRHKQSP